MNWEAIGAIGEIVGAVAVVLSLAWLAVQVRDAARATRADTELEAARMWSEYHSRVAHSPDMARIWDAGHTAPDTLSNEERQRFVWIVAEYFFLVEGLFKQRQRGFISQETWDPHEKTLAGVLDNEVLLAWWKSGVSPYSEAFVRRIDEVIGHPPEDRWGYTPLAEIGRER